jgi:hypothetical protein
MVSGQHMSARFRVFNNPTLLRREEKKDLEFAGMSYMPYNDVSHNCLYFEV